MPRVIIVSKPSLSASIDDGRSTSLGYLFQRTSRRDANVHVGGKTNLLHASFGERGMQLVITFTVNPGFADEYQLEYEGEVVTAVDAILEHGSLREARGINASGPVKKVEPEDDGLDARQAKNHRRKQQVRDRRAPEAEKLVASEVRVTLNDKGIPIIAQADGQQRGLSQELKQAKHAPVTVKIGGREIGRLELISDGVARLTSVKPIQLVVHRRPDAVVTIFLRPNGRARGICAGVPEEEASA